MGYVINKRGFYDDYLTVNKTVAGLDPLGADDFFVVQLPRLNNKENVQGIERAAREIIPELGKLSSLSQVEAMAATRDIAMIASSLVRHGVPVSSVPEVELALLTLSKITGEVPADTVTSYGGRNPHGQRIRTFTGTPEERLFIGSVNDGVRFLVKGLEFLDLAQDSSIFNPLYIELVKTARVKFWPMIVAMTEVYRSITPEFFTNCLRPYFEPKTVGGRRYLAPGGAQMPMILVDLVLWGSREKDIRYRRFWKENLDYLPVSLQRRAHKILRFHPLVETALQMSSELSISSSERAIAIRSLVELEEILVAIEKFRNQHLRVAKSNMAIRPPGSLGSGGYNAEILELLISRLRDARRRVGQTKSSLCLTR